jgi:hypothetical protein
MNMHRSILRSLTSLALCASCALGTGAAVAFANAVTAPASAASSRFAERVGSDVKLADGSVWKGEVGEKVRVTYMLNGREVTIEGTVLKIDPNVLRVEISDRGRTSVRTITSFDLKRVESIASDSGSTTAAPSQSAPAGSGGTGSGQSAQTPAQTSATGAATAKVPNIFVLPWEGMVGIGARHNEIEEIGKEADKFGPGQIIVILIDSPGGLVIEGDKIHETLVELKKRHRVVAWIKKAISAGAFTALHLDEIYFMRVGALGSITMFSGDKSIEGRELADWLRKVGEVTEMGGRPAVVGQAMVTRTIECSYDRDENGNITWYRTIQGKYVLSTNEENLTLTAETAAHSKFSDGTADTVEELAQVLQLKEWKEVSDAGRRIHERWQRTIKEAQAVKPRLVMDWMNPAGSDVETQLASQIKAGTEILKWYDRCHPVMFLEAPNLPYEKKVIEDEVERMKKQLSRIKKAQRQ